MNEKVGVFFLAAITYTMSAANLILNAFQSSFTMDLSGVIHSQAAVTALDVSANATIHVDLSVGFTIIIPVCTFRGV